MSRPRDSSGPARVVKNHLQMSLEWAITAQEELMPFCASCGAEVQGSFCPACGKPVGAAPGAAPGAVPVGGPPAATSAGLQENMANTLCYLLGLITGVLFLVLEPYNRNRNVRFHAFQSIFLHVGVIAL